MGLRCSLAPSSIRLPSSPSLSHAPSVPDRFWELVQPPLQYYYNTAFWWVVPGYVVSAPSCVTQSFIFLPFILLLSLSLSPQGFPKSTINNTPVRPY